ncbi:unnamed protein product [Closterium sp. Naga37s-1]|nr:unnamed protein product [Closterium sp. Naga37s-1]
MAGGLAALAEVSLAKEKIVLDEADWNAILDAMRPYENRAPNDTTLRTPNRAPNGTPAEKKRNGTTSVVRKAASAVKKTLSSITVTKTRLITKKSTLTRTTEAEGGPSPPAKRRKLDSAGHDQTGKGGGEEGEAGKEREKQGVWWSFKLPEVSLKDPNKSLMSELVTRKIGGGSGVKDGGLAAKNVNGKGKGAANAPSVAVAAAAAAAPAATSQKRKLPSWAEGKGPGAAVVKGADQVVAAPGHARDFSFRRDVQGASIGFDGLVQGGKGGMGKGENGERPGAAVVKGADQVVANHGHARDFSFRRDVQATSLFRSIPVLAQDIYARFPGKVVYRRERNGVEAAARELYAAVKNGANDSSGKVAVGLDCEWKPTWGKGPENPCALLQLCANADVCYLFHLKFTGVPETLRAFLKDASVVKTGVGVTEDGRKLRKDFGVEVNGLVDCSPLAQEKAVVPDGGQMVGLKTLTRLVLQKELAKPKRVQCSNWEGFPLTDAQLIYASTDAFVSLRIFQELDAMPSPWEGGNGHVSAAVAESAMAVSVAAAAAAAAAGGEREEDDKKERQEKTNKETVGKQKGKEREEKKGKEGEEKKGNEGKKSANGKEGQADVEAKTGKKSKRKQEAPEEGKSAARADAGESKAAEADGPRKKRRKQGSAGEGKGDGGSSGSKVGSLKEAAADTASRWMELIKKATTRQK